MKLALLAIVVPLLAVAPLNADDGSLHLLATGDEDGSSVPQIPNPAAWRCTQLGGISRSVDEFFWGGSQVGLCRLPDDGVIADWTLFRAGHGEGGQAVEAFAAGQWRPMAGPIETWAEQACDAAGGQVAVYAEHLRPGSTVLLCEFPDASRIEAWTLFGGPGLYPRLARALGLTPPSDMIFWPCPWPRTCAAPCLLDARPQGLCLRPDGEVQATTYACCCCGSGTSSFAPFPKRPTTRPRSR